MSERPDPVTLKITIDPSWLEGESIAEVVYHLLVEKYPEATIVVVRKKSKKENLVVQPLVNLDLDALEHQGSCEKVHATRTHEEWSKLAGSLKQGFGEGRGD